MEKEKLSIAEQEAVNQIRRWPTLYHSAHSVFHNSIVSGRGYYKWVDGILVYNEKQYKNGRYYPYPFRISEDVAHSFLRNNHSGFISVNITGDAPINHIPDDAHKDWLDFISFHLFLDSKITPDLYDIIVKAHSIRHYNTPHNPNATQDYHRDNWKEYFLKIPSYKAKLRLIEETRIKGLIPPDRYMGIDI